MEVLLLNAHIYPKKVLRICLILPFGPQSLMDDMPYHNEPGFEKETWEQSRSRGASATQLAEVCNTKLTTDRSICDIDF